MSSKRLQGVLTKPSQINEIQVLPEFEALLPKMRRTQFESLKRSLQTEGQSDDIVLWNTVIVDGMHRFKAMKELGMFPRVRQLDVEAYKKQIFEDGVDTLSMSEKDLVRHWILSRQCFRRNASRWTRCMSQLEYEDRLPTGLVAKDMASRLGLRGATKEDLAAALAGVGVETYRRAKAIKKAIDDYILPAALYAQLNNEETSISAAFRFLAGELQDREEKAQKKVIRQSKARPRRVECSGETSVKEADYLVAAKNTIKLLDKIESMLYNVHSQSDAVRLAATSPLCPKEYRRAVKNLAKSVKNLAAACAESAEVG
jgi:hypothetical protein